MSEVDGNSIIRFHQIHSDDIILKNNNTTAIKTSKNYESLLFSSRPLKPNEKMKIKFSKIEETTDIIHIGFTSNYPSSNKHFKFLKIVSKKKKNVKDNVLYFFFTSNGRIHFGVDNKEIGSHELATSTTSLLWAYVKILHPSIMEILNYKKIYDWSNFDSLEAFSLHITRGRNVQIKKNSISKINDNQNVHYAFSAQPLKIEEHVIIRVLDATKSKNKICFGLTNVDPLTVRQKNLPLNPAEFFSESYCVLLQDISWCFQENDRISFIVDSRGNATIFRNECTVLKKFDVDISRNLWIFFDISNIGSVQVFRCAATDSERELNWYETKNVSFLEKKTEESKSDKESCVVCFEKKLEVALYPCGHMCMCHGCGMEQWKGAGHGCCPICRANIKDLLKIYKI